MRYIVKWRFLLKFVVVLLASAVVIHFTHRWQVKRQVGVYLYQADLAREGAKEWEQKGDSAKTEDEREKAKTGSEEQRQREESFLSRYVIARPGDLDIRDRLGRLMCQNARTKKQSVEAFYVLEDILRRDPSR